MSEGLAFGVLQHLVGLFAPIPSRSQLEEKKSGSNGSLKQSPVVRVYKRVTVAYLGFEGIVCQARVYLNLLVSYSTERSSAIL